jgi:hypothetical protein
MYKRSPDLGVTWSPDTALTTTPEYWSVSPCIVTLDAGIHLVWTDFRDNEYGEIYYMRNLTGNATRETGRSEAGRARPRPTLARDILCLPRDMTGFGSVNLDRVPRPSLLDASGRRVLSLRPGPNDVSRLAPGVYFLSTRGSSAATVIVVR